MTTPQYSVVFSARLVASTTVSAGQVLIPSEAEPTRYVVATTANRNGRRSEGVALTAYGGSSTGSVQLQQCGTIDADISGLAAGSASWVRCSATGTIERCTPGASDDIIGYAEADGRVHLLFGMLTSAITSGGGGATPGGGIAHFWGGQYDDSTGTWTDEVGSADADNGAYGIPAEATVNGHTYPSFDGVNDALSAGQVSTLDGLDSYCIFGTFNAGDDAVSRLMRQAGQFGIEFSSQKLFVFVNNGTGSDFITGTSTINDSQWHRFVLNVDEGAASLYVDGVLEGTSTFATLSAASPAFPLLFGEGVSFYNGGISACGIATRAQTVGELLELDAALANWVGAGAGTTFGKGDVRNYGALGDSSSDNSDAFIDAFAEATGGTGLRVIVPADERTTGGYYRFTAGIGAVNGLGKGLIAIRGDGGVIEIGDAIAGDNWLQLGGTANNVAVEGLGFLPQTPSATNVGYLIQLNANSGSVRDCTFAGIGASTGLLQLYGAGRAHVERCNFLGCHAEDGYGVVTLESATEAEIAHCRFFDVGDYLTWDGTFFPSEAWIRVRDNTQWPTVSMNTTNTIHIRHCMLDEGVFYGVLVEPVTAENRIDRLLIEDCQFNVGWQPESRGIKAVTTNNVEIRRCWFGYNLAGTADDAIELVDCTNVLIERCRFDHGPRKIIIDESCINVRIVDCEGATIESHAAFTEVSETVLTELLTSGGTYTKDYEIAAGTTERLEAEVIGNAGPAGFHRKADAVVIRADASAAFVADLGAASNPKTDPLGEASGDTSYTDGGGDSTIAWSVTGANARLTVTNRGSSDKRYAIRIRRVISQTEYTGPASMPLTAWWRAPYAGSPLVGEVSVGTSGTRNLSEATNPPGTGVTLNGLTVVDHDGTNDILGGGSATDADLFNSNAGSIALLYNCDTAAAAVNSFTDAAMFASTGNIIGIAINSTGPSPFIHDGAYKNIQLTQAAGSWALVQMKWDGATLKARLNSGSWTSIAAGSTGGLSNNFSFGKRFDAGAFFNGKWATFIASDTVLSDADFDNIVAYVNDRFALSL